MIMNNLTNTISTIIPFYNNAGTLPTMLDSILSGVLVPDEIILIDDGSTDDSADIVKDYVKRYPVIKYYHQNHKGVSAARNLGISHAKCTWISFLDADDYIEPDMYEQMISAVADGECDGCICGYFTHKDGIITSYTRMQSDLLQSNDILKAIFTDDTVRGFLVTKLFKANILKQYSFDDNIAICEDLLFQTRYFANNDLKYKYVPKAFYHYIQNNSSATSTREYFVNGIFIYKPAFDNIRRIIDENYVLDSYNSILEYSMYTLLKAYREGDNSKKTVNQIRAMQKELKATPCKSKSKRRIAYQVAPILFSGFI
ncbi:Glycosyltransferase involved in cell wall bisynthesis [Butyrivibrio sp. ob235]|uniref:glycosyltransferase family 2 protein n=1 Tax=Butyrivibrio sp. ob235 TaxID=1761780 RepID=UPI0008B22E28|nr:glycosyltransferase family 2 protein [Butyrivibrio sp. ob235]SEL73952.1 Glycosyltransferase involved in cell wall bisynthesis [Butyrivibrio sp. ob235]